jgi:hypothetical protein
LAHGHKEGPAALGRSQVVRRDLTASISTVSSSWTAVQSAVQEVRYGTVHAQLKMSKTKTSEPATESCRHLPPQGRGCPPDRCRRRSQALPPHFRDSEMSHRRRYLCTISPRVEQSVVDARLSNLSLTCERLGLQPQRGMNPQVGKHSRGPPYRLREIFSISGGALVAAVAAAAVKAGMPCRVVQIPPGLATPYVPRVADALGMG